MRYAMSEATLIELRDALIDFCNRYPAIADRPIAVHSECGWLGARIASPITFYKHRCSEAISIYTNDDLDIDSDKDINIYK